MKYINNITLTVNTNLVFRDFTIINLIGVGVVVVVILTLISIWLFSFLVRQWSLRYPLFLDGYLMIKAKLKQTNKIIRLSRTLSKNYDTLKYIFRNTVKPPFTTTTLRSTGGIAVGLTVGLSSCYYGLIYEMVALMDFLIVEVPVAGAIYENLQTGWLEQGLIVTPSEVFETRIPDYSYGMCNMGEVDYNVTVADLCDKVEEIDSAFKKLGPLTQALERYYPADSASICHDLEVQAAWARARGSEG